MMHRSNRRVVAAALMGLMLTASACSRVAGHQGYVADSTLTDAIQAGVDNRESVEKTLGRPTFVSQYGTQDYYYFSRTTRQYAFNNPAPKAQQVLRIRFDQAGNVIAVDKAGMERVARIDPDGHTTPTLGRERSVLEDLFGNIGQVGAVGQGAGTADNPN
jgi:outer membrane protein assembly factor BamE (lipoprotein component of BamABCDE complex)